MITKKLVLVTVLLLCANMIFAQKAIEKKGDKALAVKNYAAAINYYKKAEEKGDGTAETSQKIAVCYYYLNNYDKSIEYFDKVNRDAMQADYLTVYGIVKQSAGEYSEASEIFKAAKGKGSTTPLLPFWISSCEWAAENNSDYPGFDTRVQETVINNASMGIQYFGDQVVFGANPTGARGSMSLDLYYAANAGGSIGRPFLLANNLVYPFREGGVAFSDNNNTIYFTKEELVGGGKYVLKIFTAERDGSRWKKISALPFNSGEYSCAYPALSADGRTMVFSCNAQGGKGGYDLWVTQKMGDTWGKIVNLKELNTEGDETTPYFFDDNILFFASDGHKGYGGLDVYFSIPQNGKWTNVTNAHKPINSARNDFGLVINPKNLKEGFAVSNRDGNGTDDRFYALTIDPEAIKRNMPGSGGSTTSKTSSNKTVAEKEENSQELENRKAELLKKYKVRAVSELNREDREKFNEELYNARKYEVQNDNNKTSKNTSTTTTNNNKTTNTTKQTTASNNTTNTTKQTTTTTTNNSSSNKTNSNSSSNKANTTANGVVFKVQFESSPKPKAEINSIKGMPWERYFHKGLYRYTVGAFATVAEADRLKDEALSLGFTDAFVVAFDAKTNERIEDYEIYPNKDKNKNTNNTTIDRSEVVYKVQILSVKNRPESTPTVNGVKADYYQWKGMHSYTVGTYNTVAEADQMKKKAIAGGHKGAFVVAFDKKTGQRLPNFRIYGN